MQNEVRLRCVVAESLNQRQIPNWPHQWTFFSWVLRFLLHSYSEIVCDFLWKEWWFTQKEYHSYFSFVGFQILTLLSIFGMLYFASLQSPFLDKQELSIQIPCYFAANHLLAEYGPRLMTTLRFNSHSKCYHYSDEPRS